MPTRSYSVVAKKSRIPLRQAPVYGVRMQTFAKIFGSLLALSGSVWILQGLNVSFAPGSFMTGNVLWVIYGGSAVVAGLTLAIYGIRSNR